MVEFDIVLIPTAALGNSFGVGKPLDFVFIRIQD